MMARATILLVWATVAGAWHAADYGSSNLRQQQTAPVNSVRASLRAVASMQNVYYQEHGTFSADIEVLKQIPGCKIAEGVTVTIVYASENGFGMEATHPEYEGRSCVQWYGEPGVVPVVATKKEGKRGDESPGRVVCDDP